MAAPPAAPSRPSAARPRHSALARRRHFGGGAPARARVRQQHQRRRPRRGGAARDARLRVQRPGAAAGFGRRLFHRPRRRRRSAARRAGGLSKPNGCRARAAQLRPLILPLRALGTRRQTACGPAGARHCCPGAEPSASQQALRVFRPSMPVAASYLARRLEPSASSVRRSDAQLRVSLRPRM